MSSNRLAIALAFLFAFISPAAPSLMNHVGPPPMGLAHSVLLYDEYSGLPFDDVFDCHATATLTAAQYCADLLNSGQNGNEPAMANEFFAGSPPADAHFLLVRSPTGGGRARLWSAPGQSAAAIATACPFNANPALECQFTITYDVSEVAPNGYTLTFPICFDTSATCLNATETTANISNTLMTALITTAFAQPLAQTTGSVITQQTCAFTGYITNGFMEVSAMSAGNCLQVGEVVTGTFGSNTAGLQILAQVSGTPGGVGEWALFNQNGAQASYVPSGVMGTTWGQLTVGTVSGPGDRIASGMNAYCLGSPVCIGSSGATEVGSGFEAYVSGGTVTCPIVGQPQDCYCVGTNCNGTVWIIDKSQAISSRAINATSPIVGVNAVTGARFRLEQQVQVPYINPAGTFSYPTGTAAVALGLTQTSLGTGPCACIDETWGPWISPISEVVLNYPTSLSYLVNTDTSAFTYIQQAIDPDNGYDDNSKKAQIQTWAGITSGRYTSIPNDFWTMQAATAYPPTQCTPGFQVFSTPGAATYNPHHCRRLDWYMIGAGGNSTAGVANTGPGVTGASGTQSQILDMTMDADDQAWTLSVPAAGGSSATITPALTGTVTNNSGVLVAQSGGNASGTGSGGTAGVAGGFTTGITAIGGTTGGAGCTGAFNGGTTAITGVTGCVTNTTRNGVAGALPVSGIAHGGLGGPGAPTSASAGKAGGASAVFAAGSGGGGAGTGTAGGAATSLTASGAGGNGVGPTAGGVATTTSGQAGNPGAAATAGNAGAGGSGGAGSTTTAGIGGAGSSGTGLGGTACGVGSGGGGGGGGASSGTGTAGAGGAAGNYGGVGGSGGAVATGGTGGAAGASAGGVICVVYSN